MTLKKGVRVTIFVVENITNSDSVFVASVTMHAKRMCFFILSPVACLALGHFFTLFHKREDHKGGGEAIEHKMRVSIFSTIFSETFPTIRKMSEILS